MQTVRRVDTGNASRWCHRRGDAYFFSWYVPCTWAPALGVRLAPVHPLRASVRVHAPSAAGRQQWSFGSEFRGRREVDVSPSVEAQQLANSERVCEPYFRFSEFSGFHS